MALTPEKRQRLRTIFKAISTPEELAKLEDKEVMRMTAQSVANLGEAMNLILEGSDIADEGQKKTAKSIATMDAKIMGGFMELSKAIVDKLDEVKAAGYQGSKGQENFALGLQNMAKSLAEGFAGVKSSIDMKPVPVWNWPQYLYSGMRDKQFSPINPSTDGIGVGDFDKVEMFLSEKDSRENYRFLTDQGDGNYAFKVAVIVQYTDENRNVLDYAYRTNVDPD